MRNRNIQLIFVAGVPRSGTTLVQNILDCHPDIYAGPEFDRIPNIIDLRRRINNSIRGGRIEIYVTPKDVDLGIASLIKGLLFPIAEKLHCSYVSEKTPWNVLAFEDLIEILPEAKFIHVVRHPHAVFASMRNVAVRARKKGIPAPDFTKDISLACFYIESVLKLINTLENKYPGKIFTVKYERLVEDPQMEIKRMCEYLGVNFQERMLRPGDFKHAGEDTMTKHSIWYTEEMYNSNFTAANVDKWKGQLSGSAVAFMNHVFKNNDHIGKYGYSFRNEGGPAPSRLLGYVKFKKYRRTHDFSRIPFRTLP